MRRPITCLINNVLVVSICFLLCRTSTALSNNGFVKKAETYSMLWTIQIPGLTSLSKAERFPWHSAFTAVPFHLLLLPEQYLYIVKNMCVCVCVCVCTYLSAYILYMNYRCYQISLRVKHFYTNWKRCEVLIGYLSVSRRTGGDWENT
jgi:hypothetical protein